MLRSLRRRVRRAWRRWRVKRRRHKLVLAYARVIEIEHDRGPGFTPLLGAYDRLHRRGLVSISADGLEWHWPEGDP